VINRTSIVLLFAVTPLASASAQTSRPAAGTTDVPVTKVVLFSSGVGYFEHGGTVRGNGSTNLQFRTSQINDILKSIVLQDQDGGRVGAITYPSQDPLAKTLKSFQVDIAGNPSLADLLNELRGARVTIQVQQTQHTGTILGVETRSKPVDKGEPATVSVLNLLTGSTIRAIELPSISSLTLDDPQLQDELTKALSALVQARDQDKKPVTINFTGTGERRVRIGYVVETPVWKTSYRLLLGDKPSAGRLQGWAIVENQTESDWNDVSLSLVSGRPMSFIMDLYRPLYATRPTVVPELFAGLRPQLYDDGISENRERVGMVAGGVAKESGLLPPAAAPMAGRPTSGRRIAVNPDETQNQLALSETVLTGAVAGLDPNASVQPMAAAAKLGALFQYTVDNVTLPRQKSAMLPIVTDSIELERVSIFNAAVLRANPLNGLRLKNTTGKHLLEGPVTVLDKGSYAGDARLDNVPPGQERFLSYGIDLDMVVDNTKTRQASAVTTAKISAGILVIERKLVASQEYAADNKTSKDKTLVIEHPIRAGWKLSADTRKPFETTPTVYRFKGTAVADKVTTLTVQEELVRNETVVLMAADLGQLLSYNRTGELPQNVRDALGKAVQLKQAAVDVDREIAARDGQIAAITNEQNRIRENMKTVAPSTQYYERLLAKLNEQESSIESLQKERASLVSKRAGLQRDLEAYLNNLTLG
jgi:hypothetical protein